MTNYNNELISIIMPCYNSSKWIKQTIDAVQNQTYTNWELLITDDCSSDNTVECIKKIKKKDNRIQLFISDINQGAAKSRNNSLKHVKGRFIAYLDSDDLWTYDKLEKQINYMLKRNISMCYTDYDIVNENGEYRKTIHVPKKVDYEGYLKKPITCTHSIMFDMSRIDKNLLIMPDIRRGQDGATWLQVLKTGVNGYALSESLAKYRRHDGSLSSNKINAIKRTWYLYRKVEKLPLQHAIICFISYIINAIKKYS